VTGDELDDIVARIGADIVLCRALGNGAYDPPSPPYNDTPGFQGATSIEYAFGDVTGDDTVDLIVISTEVIQGTSRIDILPGLGDGQFDTAILVAESHGTTDYGPPAVADLDGDGREDIVVGRANAAGTFVFTSDAAGNWTVIQTGGPTVTDRPHLVDVDADGDLDIVSLITHRRNVAVALGDGSGQFEPVYQVAVAERAQDLIVADLDRDGILDIAASDDLDGSISILKGLGNGTWERLTPANATTPLGLEAADLDGNTFGDLAVIGPDGLEVLLNHTYLPSSPFTDFGHGLKGSFGYPVLLADGTLIGGDPMSFRMSHAAPGGFGWFVIGLNAIDLPFAAGGVVVPAPDLVFGPFVLPPNGSLDFVATWPTGLAGGVRFWIQFWIQDPFAATGFASTTGVRAVTGGD
jgi:hypothetical protein